MTAIDNVQSVYGGRVARIDLDANGWLRGRDASGEIIEEVRAELCLITRQAVAVAERTTRRRGDCLNK